MVTLQKDLKDLMQEFMVKWVNRHATGHGLVRYTPTITLY